MALEAHKREPQDLLNNESGAAAVDSPILVSWSKSFVVTGIMYTHLFHY